jgi:hypothetical protein
MVERFPFSATEELSNSPEELIDLILKVASDRLIRFKNAALELERKPLVVGQDYVVGGKVTFAIE